MEAEYTRKPGRVLPVRAGVLYFALVFSAGFFLGALRVTLLVPRVGVRIAELTEAPLMLLVTLLAARFVIRRLSLPTSVTTRLLTGLVALGLLLAAEIAVATILQGQSLSGYIKSRDPVSGAVYVALLCVFALMPAILMTARRRPQ